MSDHTTLEKQRHTLAHALAHVVLQRYPHAKATIGPVVENGFYYDFDFSAGSAPGEEDLPKLTKEMRRLLPHWKQVTHEEMSATDARGYFHDNEYKCELIDEIEAAGETITLYTIGDGEFRFVDLCRGGHVDDPSSEISADAFELTTVAGAYWRGDQERKMLTRIYGIAFSDHQELQHYKEQLAEAKRRDHRKLGKELDLFTFSELVGSGLPLFTPRGNIIRDSVIARIDSIQNEYGYQKVTIPHITKSDLYKTSGHWEKFGDELFKVKGQSTDEFVLKPMNCPHHTQIFSGRPRSYKELPIRYAETTMVYRDEQHGELLGLSRVRSITQDDGHVFCTEEQIEQEVRIIVDVIKRFYTSLEMYSEDTCWVSLSVRDPHSEDYLGSDVVWDTAESTLEKIAQEIDLPYKRVEGEAAFYGPKLDFMFKDALGRERQLATAQLDFVMPERFGLEYTDNEGKKRTPVMIHRAIAGSLERFMAIMIEHFAGEFPLWLAPEQLCIIPIAEVHHAYAVEQAAALELAGFRCSVAVEKESMGKKVRSAKERKTPYLIIIGDTEMADRTLKVEHRSGTSMSTNITDLITTLQKEVSL